MSLMDRVKAKAKKEIKTIVFPEGDEIRTVQAAAILKKEGLAEPVLIGNVESICRVAKETGTDLSGIQMVDPLTSKKAKEYADALYEIRKNKGVTMEDAQKLIQDPMYYGIMMVKQNDADGLVSGAIHTTGDMLRPALQIIKTKPGVKIVSSSFLMKALLALIPIDFLLVILHPALFGKQRRKAQKRR